MNIVLIGMAGCGKSTIGVLLAKALGMSFVDTDLLIQEREERLLQEIIDLDGLQKFINIEEKVILSLNIDHSVIATGGSAVYGNFAMEHLKKKGKIIFLNLSYENIEKRIKNITTRGIAMNKGQTLKDVFDERMNLYLKYADIEIDCDDKDIEEIIEEIVTKISKESI